MGEHGAFSSDDHTLVTGCRDRVRMWDVQQHLQVTAYETPGVWHTSIAFLDNETLLAGYGLWRRQALSESGEVRSFNLRTGDTKSLIRTKNLVNSIAISHDGTRFATGGGGVTPGFGDVRIWELGRHPAGISLENPTDLGWTAGRVDSVAFSPKGGYLAAGGKAAAEGDAHSKHPRHVQIWNTRDGSIHTELEGDTDAAFAVRFSPDSSLLAAVFVTGDDGVVVWNTTTGIREWSRPSGTVLTNSLTFSPDGKLIAAGDSIGTNWLLETATGKELRELPGNSSNVLCVEFSPDGKTLASVGLGGSVRLWHVAAGEELASFEVPVTHASLAFSPDGKSLAAGGTDKRVTLWHATIERQSWPTSLR